MKATLEGAPEGVRLFAFAEPRTVEEFNEIVAAAGGREAFEPAMGADCVVADIGDGRLRLYAPLETREKRPPAPKNAFIAAFIGDDEDGGES